MIQIELTDPTWLTAYWLVFTRVMAVMFQLPLMDNMTLPNTLKVLLILLISYLIMPVVYPSVLKDIRWAGENAFWSLTVFNTVVGLILGYFVKSILSLFIAAGSMITQQVGFAALRYYDPQAQQQVGPFEKLIQWTIVVTIILSGALIPMLKGMTLSFDSINVYELGMLKNITATFLHFFNDFFTSALMLSTPVIFINLLVMTILGIISRIVPQMNIIMTSFAVNIGMGLLVFTVSSQEFFNVGFNMYTDFLGRWFSLVKV